MNIQMFSKSIPKMAEAHIPAEKPLGPFLMADALIGDFQSGRAVVVDDWLRGWGFLSLMVHARQRLDPAIACVYVQV